MAKMGQFQLAIDTLDGRAVGEVEGYDRHREDRGTARRKRGEGYFDDCAGVVTTVVRKPACFDRSCCIQCVGTKVCRAVLASFCS